MTLIKLEKGGIPLQAVHAIGFVILALFHYEYESNKYFPCWKDCKPRSKGRKELYENTSVYCRLLGKGKLRSLQKRREPYIFKLLLFKRPFSSLSFESVCMSELCNMRRNMQISRGMLRKTTY